MLHNMLGWLTSNKTAFEALAHIATTVAFAIGGFWALRKMLYERPFESAVDIRVEGTAHPCDEAVQLLELNVTLKNIGHSVVRLGETERAKHRSSVRVYRLVSPQSPSGVRALDWDDPSEAVKLVHEPFVRLFRAWFESTSYVTLEAGEQERYAAHLLLPADVKLIGVVVKVYESKVRRRLLGRPYYWLASRSVDCFAARIIQEPVLA